MAFILENLFQLASVADPFAASALSKPLQACCGDPASGGFENVLSLFGDITTLQDNSQGSTLTKPFSGTLTPAGSISTQICLDECDAATVGDLLHQTEQPVDFDFAATVFFAISVDQLDLQPTASSATEFLNEVPSVDLLTDSTELLQDSGIISQLAGNVSPPTLDSKATAEFSLIAYEMPITAGVLPIDGDLDSGSDPQTRLNSFDEAIGRKSVDHADVPAADFARTSIASQNFTGNATQLASKTQVANLAATSDATSVPATLSVANSFARPAASNNFQTDNAGVAELSVSATELNQLVHIQQSAIRPDNHPAITYAPIKSGIQDAAVRSNSIVADQFIVSQPDIPAIQVQLGTDVTPANDLKDASQQLAGWSNNTSTTGIIHGASTQAFYPATEIRRNAAQVNAAINMQLPSRAVNSTVASAATPTQIIAQFVAPADDQNSRIANDHFDSTDANTILLEDSSLPRQTFSNAHVNSLPWQTFSNAHVKSLLASARNRSQETIHAKHNPMPFAGGQTPSIESGFSHVPNQVPASQPELAANNAGIASSIATTSNTARVSIPEQILAAITNRDSSHSSDSNSKSFEMRVKLSPPSLGEVVLLIHHTDLEKSASIFVADESIRHLVESKIEHLQESLRQLGFDSVEVDVFQQGRHDNRFQQERQHAPNHRPTVRHGNSQSPVDEDLAVQPNTLSRQRIDLVV